MSTNPTIDHCRAPNPVTYQTLFWLIIAEFVLGLPLNLSVLYIFLFRVQAGGVGGDVSETPSAYGAVCCVFESRADRT
ncbi:hypothetical protein EYF80_067833 [Liparis tanakae]|uniref:Uncharacterized protein n=1 Tax=Liparis tanakae TaxID=230148 RepID=A0A4Z2DZV7_9TELE|nr:hypothetical protein EYF80_067833 [Liparis tanakae]